MSGFAIASGIGFDYAGFYPTNLDNCKLWLDATDIGVQGYSLDFDGIDDYVQATNVITSYPFTLECWVRIDVTNATQRILGISETSTTDKRFGIFYSGITLSFNIIAVNGASSSATSNNFTPLANTWYHIAGVFESTTSRKIYINGIDYATSTGSVNFNNSVNNKIEMARHSDNNSSPLNGKLSDVRVWNTARTAQQIADNYNKRLIGNESGLVGYWKLDEGNTTTVADSTSNANSGTISGALWTDLEPFTEQPTDTQGVRSWKDKSGNGYNATQATSANRPTFRTNQINGKPAVIFDGTNDVLTIDSSTSTFKFLHSDKSTVFAVFKAGVVSDPNAVYGILGSGGANTTNIGYDIWWDDRVSQSRNNAILLRVYRGVSSTNVIATSNDNVYTANTFNFLTITGDPANATAANRSSLQVATGTILKTNTQTATLSTSNATYNLQIGAAGNNAIRLNGSICEIIIYNRLLESGEIKQVQNYLKSKWDL